MSSDSWSETSLGEVVDLLAGFPFKSADYVADASGIRLLRGDNVAQGVLRWDSAKRWPGDAIDADGDYLLREDDVIIAMDRPWIEAGLKYARVRTHDLPSLLVQRVARLRPRDGLGAPYLYFLIGSPPFTGYVLSVQTGTAVPHISAAQIRAYRFRLPPLEEQRRIAGVLGALDDKIECNRRLASRCDAVAATAFSAMLSEGARVATVVRVGDVAAINEVSHSARSHPTEIEYIDISGVAPRELVDLKRLGYVEAPSRARRVVRSGDTLVSTVRPERRAMLFVSQAAVGLTASTGFAVVSPRDVEATFLYRVITSDECIGHLTSAASGSAYPAVNPSVLADWRFPLPSDGGKRFHDLAGPLERMRWHVLAQNRQLMAFCDSLLPKLVSGEIRVPESYEPPAEAAA